MTHNYPTLPLDVEDWTDEEVEEYDKFYGEGVYDDEFEFSED